MRGHAAVLLAALSAAAVALAAGPAAPAPGDAAGLYTQFLQALDAASPASYACPLSGAALERRLATIPADAVEAGQKPETMVYFRKDRGAAIRVTHVDTTFASMFKLYNAYVGMTGAYLASKGSTWEEFSRSYEMTVAAADGAGWTLLVRRRNSPSDTYGTFRLSRAFSIDEASFYNGGALAYVVRNAWRQVGRYRLPDAIAITVMKNGRAQEAAYLRFGEYRINPYIPESLFAD